MGNTRGLRKYNLGLTQAQLKTASYAEIQQKFQQQFSGANQAYLATYAGKLDILKVAADRAKETIGKGLVDALVLASGKQGDVENVADAMSSLANYTADAVRGVGYLVGELAQLEVFKSSLKAIKMAETNEQSLGAQEREAYRSEDYQNLCKAIGHATEQAEALKWQLEAAKLRVEIWRTEQASNRNIERMTR